MLGRSDRAASSSVILLERRPQTAAKGSGRRRRRMAFGCRRAVGLTSPSFHAVRKPERNCSSVGAAGVPSSATALSATSTRCCWAARRVASSCPSLLFCEEPGTYREPFPRVESLLAVLPGAGRQARHAAETTGAATCALVDDPPNDVAWLSEIMGNTAIGTYCPRARPGAPVATPIAWDEVKPDLDPAAFTLRTIPDRLARRKHDAWRGYFETVQKPTNVTVNAERDVALGKISVPASPRTAIVRRLHAQAAVAVARLAMCLCEERWQATGCRLDPRPSYVIVASSALSASRAWCRPCTGQSHLGRNMPSVGGPLP